MVLAVVVATNIEKAETLLIETLLEYGLAFFILSMISGMIVLLGEQE